MVRKMITKVADYIVSPLGMGTHVNYERVKEGSTMLRKYVGLWGLPTPFMASMLDDTIIDTACRETGIPTSDYTRFERIALLAATRALQETDIDPSDKHTLFIISTTKGNIELLDSRLSKNYPANRLLLTETAQLIAKRFRNPNTPLVVCNACISGLDAQLEAAQALETNRYKYAVVIGADVLSPFIVSGFQSLKALSEAPCRPFDEERIGLNLGEAAACIVYSNSSQCTPDSWHLTCGTVRNDAFHTSSPSKTAEGAYLALSHTVAGKDTSNLAFINLHGTATLFNDEMEAVAIHRAGLGSVPTNGLKGYFGHTLGASGIIETLISMEAVDDHTVLATKGFEHSGVSKHIDISHSHRATTGNAFIKMMSGFGGCNAAAWFSKDTTGTPTASHRLPPMVDGHITHTIRLTERAVEIDGKELPTSNYGMDMLKSLYHTFVNDYPKFHKMDPLCKLGFIASELLLKVEAETDGTERFVLRDDRAIIVIGKSASLCADKNYQQTIQSQDDYYPSPSAFIYTLPNIVTGEIAIRNHYHGKTSYLLLDSCEQTIQLLQQALNSSGTTSVIGGWVEIGSTERFEATLYIINKE